MTTGEMDILNTFRGDPPPPDPDTARRAYAYATMSDARPERRPTDLLRRWELRRRPRVGLVALVAVLAAIGVGFGLNQTLGGSAHHKLVTGRTPGGSHSHGLGAVSGYDFAGSNPFGDQGTSVTISQLAADAPAVPLPNSPLANSQSVGSVWETQTGSAAVFYPSSHIELMVVRRTGPLDTTGLPSNAVQTIGGYTAIVASGIPDATPPVNAQILVALPANKTLELTGPSLDDLLSVARTLPLP